MSRKTHPRFELYRRLKYQHQIRMSPNAMDTVEQFYHDNIKGSIFHVGMYRVINIVFTVLILTGIVIFWNDPVLIWFITITMVAFLIYNGIHLVINAIQYKTIKDPEPFEQIPTNEPTTAYGQE